MKKALLLIFATGALTISAKAQTTVYQPWPNDSAAWFYESIDSYGTYRYYYTEWLGDTLINSVTYKKVFVRNDNTSWKPQYAGGVRQDIPNEKIYTIGLSGLEHDVSVSQHLSVGDTMNVIACPTQVITSIDSVLIGSKFHKSYNLSCTDSTATGAYIVGVGEAGWNAFEAAEHLLCFSVANVNQYGMAPYCQLVPLDVKDRLVFYPHQIDIYPNPVSDKLTIHTKENEPAEFILYDLISGRMLQTEFTKTATIDVSQLSGGLYIYELRTKEGIVTKGKVVKE